MQVGKFVVRLSSVFLLIFTFSLSALAQSGKITGRVVDQSNHAVIGASVKIVGTGTGTATDVDGRFTLNIDSKDSITIEISAVGYTPKSISGVMPGANEDLSVNLTTASNDLNTVTVKTSARRESTNSLIQFQKNTNAVAQVISAEAIKRSPDRNTGEALKRVTGLSIQEGRYIIVRGLSDRYNQAMLNGVLLSSTEPDRKTFSFDVFPAAIVENIIINKTFIPEYSAEWAGGLIQINTRDIPTKNFLNVQLGTNFNTNTVFKDIHTYPGGKLDWLGMDDGTRALPDNFPTRNEFAALSDAEKIEWGKQVAGGSWATEKKSGLFPTLGQSFQANGGFSTKLFGKDFGGAVTATYNRSVRNLSFDNTIFNVDNTSGNKATPSFAYNNNRYSEDVLWGALANFGLRLNPNNKISFKNLISVNSSDYTTVRTGKDYESNATEGENVKAWEMGFRNNTFFNTQLNGEHNISSWNSKINWFGSFTILDQYIPNQRRLQYNQDPAEGSPYLVLISGGASQRSGSVFYSNLNDYIYNFGGDVSKNFELFGNKQTVKAGYNFQVKDRLYDAQPYYIPLPSDNPDLKAQDPSTIFDPENFGTADNLFHFDRQTNDNFRYLANTILNAGFLQFDNAFTDKLRVVWGVRYEHYDQLIGSVYKTDPRYNNSIVDDFLPALNITYKINNRSNFRIAGSQTVVRPEFRELSELAFYNFELGASVVGNPNLLRTKVTNADIRYEVYQRPGELFTIGGFYKFFDGPIEQAFNQTGAGSSSTFNFIDNKNVSAQSFGVEVEIRKKLDFTPAFERFTVFGNVSYIYNRVKFQEESLDRPMQGQSPYLVNVGLQYDVEEIGLNTTLLFNQVGRRIAFVGNEQYPAIWEAPRPLLDLQVAKKIIHNKAEIKLSATDLINQYARFYIDLDDSKKFEGGADALAIKRKYGTGVSLTFSYNIK